MWLKTKLGGHRDIPLVCLCQCHVNERVSLDKRASYHSSLSLSEVSRYTGLALGGKTGGSISPQTNVDSRIFKWCGFGMVVPSAEK